MSRWNLGGRRLSTEAIVYIALIAVLIISAVLVSTVGRNLFLVREAFATFSPV